MNKTLPQRGMQLRFKTEISLLLLAIILYILSAFCYSYEAKGMLPVINYPYRDYALPLAIIASVLLVIAAILYSKRR